MTDDRTLSGLRHYRLFPQQPGWTSEACDQFPWAKIKASTGLFPLEARNRESFPCLLQRPVASWSSSGGACLHLRALHCSLFPPSCLLTFSSVVTSPSASLSSGRLCSHLQAIRRRSPSPDPSLTCAAPLCRRRNALRFWGLRRGYHGAMLQPPPRPVKE